MNSNFFQKNNIKINKIFPNIDFKKNFIINDIKPLKSKEMTLLLTQQNT